GDCELPGEHVLLEARTARARDRARDGDAERGLVQGGGRNAPVGVKQGRGLSAQTSVLDLYVEAERHAELGGEAEPVRAGPRRSEVALARPLQLDLPHGRLLSEPGERRGPRLDHADTPWPVAELVGEPGTLRRGPAHRAEQLVREVAEG